MRPIRIHSAVMLSVVVTMVASLDAQTPPTPSQHHFPALGMSEQRQVEIAWNRFYDCAQTERHLQRLQQAFPELTHVYSVGESVGGRPLWCLEVTAFKVGDPRRKPAMYIDGNIHGNEVQAGEAVLYTAWYLCHQYGRLDKVTQLLQDRVFYLFPSINPDGRDTWFHQAQNANSSRSGVQPTDNDQDGLMDEDDVDDLNGDGHITQMRIKDPHGRYKPHPDFPEYLMVRVKPDEPGQYRLLGLEGIDNDHDGRINEDGRGGYDMNRNWAFDWQPNFVQYGAKDYPFCLPETRAIAEFVRAHPNIAACQSYHNSGGMILRGPGRDGGDMQASDDRILEQIAARGEQILPFYRSMVTYSDLYTVWGGEDDWFYGACGILSLTNEMWNRNHLYKTPERPSPEQQAEFMKYVLLEEGIIPWQEYDHPTYGKIEIGGTQKNWGRVPPSFLLEEELHRNMAFTLFHADMMPLLRFGEIVTKPLAQNLHEIWVTIENQRLIPTRTEQDVKNHISPPDIVSLQGPQVRILSAGVVTDRFFRKVEPVKRRPERVELATLNGKSATRVQFVVSGHGAYTVTVDSAKGGLHSLQGQLP